MNNEQLEVLIAAQRQLRKRVRKVREERVAKWMDLATGFMAIVHRHRQEQGRQPKNRD